MRLTFLGKETTGGQSPTLYATDRESYVVQGWIVTDPDILGRLEMADHETIVEVPAKLLAHLAKDGLTGELARHEPPIVYVKTNGNLILHGPRVVDPAVMALLDIPDHETCIEVSKAGMRVLVEQR